MTEKAMDAKTTAPSDRMSVQIGRIRMRRLNSEASNSVSE